ncbi:putative germin-like protein 2-1 [Glycine max]|nr:putative germin-like protein 2-1 [Glycine max]
MDVPPIYKGGKQSPFLNSSIRIQKQNINGSLLDNTPKIINMVTRAHFFCLMALTFTLALAADHSPLQDFCVADPKSQVLVNGLACKDPTLVKANDFFFRGLHLEGNTSNPVGSKVAPVTVSQLPGLNTLGISLARIDFAPWGTNPPHTHPRATEILTVIEGTLEVGFVTSNPGNRHVTKVLQKGDVFVFPVGLVHYQRNVGYGNAVAIAALSSQNPGVITIANAVFGATPDIASDVLAKAFQVDKDVVADLKSKF